MESPIAGVTILNHAIIMGVVPVIRKDHPELIYAEANKIETVSTNVGLCVLANGK